ncbi:MAG TPA: family 1 encapsulin nanocompartment shell protein [Pseudomonadota bacterium]|nr:family 1 encapsulin nanocompartment shell protein [Pseudomonadota bacterium]
MPDTSNFLTHEHLPLSAERWRELNMAVVEVARRRLVGRRFLDLYGPLGAGVQSVHNDVFTGTERAAIGILGEEPIAPVRTAGRQMLTIPILYKDFSLYWRDLLTSEQVGSPLDLSAAAGASSYVADREDDMIFNGIQELGLPGLATVAGRNAMPLGDWSQVGAAIQTVASAIERLVEAGFYGPYCLVTSPHLYAKLARFVENSGVSELGHIRELCTDGVFRTSVLPQNCAVLVSTGPQNFDLAVAQDFRVAYLGAQQMNHPFRVFECAVLRIKRAQAICTLEPSK